MTVSKNTLTTLIANGSIDQGDISLFEGIIRMHSETTVDWESFINRSLETVNESIKKTLIQTNDDAKAVGGDDSFWTFFEILAEDHTFWGNVQKHFALENIVDNTDTTTPGVLDSWSTDFGLSDHETVDELVNEFGLKLDALS
jgi:hypothetical protein